MQREKNVCIILLSFLEINGVEVVNKEVKDGGVYVTSFDNTIVLNDRRYYEKLGAKNIIKIEASSELMNAYEEAVKKEIEKHNEEMSKIKTSHLKYYSFNKHMNDVNNF